MPIRAGSLLKNKVVSFMLLKYVAFGLQFVNAILIAKLLGLYFFGIYGFAFLLLQYLSYTNFGINYSFNVLYSSTPNATQTERDGLTVAAIGGLMGVALLLLLAYLFTKDLSLFDKYRFSDYALLLLPVAILQHFNTLYINISRLHGKVNDLNVFYLILPLSQLCVCFFFEGEDLFWALLYALLGANVFSLLFFVVRNPVRFNIRPERATYAKLLKRGVFLLVYNLSFYAILMTAKTLVSYFYSIEDFGLFNFSNSLSQAILMLLGSLNFLFYPKLLNIISREEDNAQLIAFIEKVRKYYLTLTLLVVFGSMLVLPPLFYFLPDYRGAFVTIQLLLLGQLLVNNNFGYSTLLVQRSKENQLTGIALVSVGLIILTALLFFRVLGLPFESVAVSVVIGVLFYDFSIVYFGNRLTQQFAGIPALLKYVYQVNFFAPIGLFMAMSWVSSVYYLNLVAALVLYFVLNRTDLKAIAKGGFQLLKNDDLMKIK